MAQTLDKPNGPVSAALLAGGIGAAAFGLFTLLSETIASFSAALVFVKPVGALSGKSICGVLAFLASWLVFHFLWKGKETDFGKISALALVLLGFGLLTTFPPVWGLFGGG